MKKTTANKTSMIFMAGRFGLAGLLFCAPLWSLQAPTPVVPAGETQQSIKAQYSWGYAGNDGQGKGVMNLLLDPGARSLTIELHGLGERIALVSGDGAAGYRLQIPRQSVDVTRPTIEALQLPFLSKLGGLERLYRFLQDGECEGVKVTKRDGQGPVKLRYTGKDAQGQEYMVWLERTRWEKEKAPKRD